MSLRRAPFLFFHRVTRLHPSFYQNQPSDSPMSSKKDLRELAVTTPRVRVLVGGTALFMSFFGLSWYALQRRQERKDAQALVQPGSMPTWESRMYQALFPADNATSPATLRNREHANEPSHTPPPLTSGGHQGETKSSPDRARRAVPEAGETKEGVALDPNSRPHPGQEPTPQRTNDGRVYSKSKTHYA